MKTHRIYLLLIVILTINTAYAQRLPKVGTTEYKACQKASLVALDSLLRNYREISNEITIENLQTFVDEQCAKFKNDTEFMIGVADLYMTSLGNEEFCAQRYADIKKRYPNHMETYLREANLFFQFAWRDYPTYDAEFLLKAKSQVDSAKIMFPNASEPYMRWAYWQAPYRQVRQSGYENLSVDHELEELKRKFPQSPCYREMARYYIGTLAEKKDKISTDNKTNYIVYAAEFYAKEDQTLMNDAHIVDYADICNKTNDRENLEKGLDILNYGIGRNPDYPYFYRYKLWIQANLAGIYKKAGEKEKSDQTWQEVVETGSRFFANSDSIGKLPADYKCMAMASDNIKDYAQAIEYYNKQIAVEKDTAQLMSAMRKVVECYNRQKEYENAISTFKKYEKIKQSTGKDLNYYDYQYVVMSYMHAVEDTTKTVQERLDIYSTVDSILAISAERTPEEYYEISERRLIKIMFDKLRLEYGQLGYEQVKMPVFLEATQRLTTLEGKMAEGTLSDKEYYILMEGYHWTLVHYMGTNDKELQYQITEKMISLDMPSEMELVTLNQGYKDAYREYVDEAQELNKALAPKYGKKKKKSSR